MNLPKRFPHLKNLAVKENDIMNFGFEDFKSLEIFEASDKLYESFDLEKELKYLSNLKIINLTNIILRIV